MKPGFHSELYARSYRSDKWKLTRELVYTTDIFDTPIEIRVRKGFVTDLASIPKRVRSLIQQVGRHRRPAVVHDFLYHPDTEHCFTRRDCDKIFLEGMKVVGVSRWKRTIMHKYVRAFGGNCKRWKGKRRK